MIRSQQKVPSTQQKVPSTQQVRSRAGRTDGALGVPVLAA
jgi:hypothetical protein